MSSAEDIDKARTVISPEPDPHAIARQLADIRLHVNALEASTKEGSLPEGLRATRRTMAWSASLVAAALIVSSLVRGCTESRSLEHRVEALERATKGL